MPLFLKAFLASLPILITLVLMAGLMWPAKRVMPLAWLTAAAAALIFWRMEPLRAAAATVEGFLGALNILIIVFGAILLLNTLIHSGAMAVISRSTLLWVLAASYAALVVSPLTLLNPTMVIINFFGGLFDRYFGAF